MQSTLSYGSRGLASGPEMGLPPLSSSRSAYVGAPLSSSGLGPTGNGSSLLLSDYGSRGTGYSYSSSLSGGVGGSSTNGTLGSSSASYGYTTESLSSTRSSSMAAISDYERRDAYDPYVPTGPQIQQTTRDRQPEYRPTSNAYDLGTRMAPMGSSTTSSMMDSSMDRPTSRISDTIIINNVSIHEVSVLLRLRSQLTFVLFALVVAAELDLARPKGQVL